MAKRLAAVLLILVLAAGACGNGDDDDAAEATTTTEAQAGDDDAADEAQEPDGTDVAGATQAVTATWTRFFDPSTPPEEGLAMLENGEAHREAAAASAQQRATVSVNVKNVLITGPTNAEVTYDILTGGSVAVPDSKGVAVYEDGRWKVSEQTFCALLAIGGIQDPACEGVVS